MNKSKHLILIVALTLVVFACQKNTEPNSDSTSPFKEKTTTIKKTPIDIKSKRELSREKLKTVKTLKTKLAAKSQDLLTNIEHFEAEIRANVAEIKSEKKELPEDQYEQSIQNKRIAVCLKTIQRADSYKGILVEAFHKTEAVQIELECQEKLLGLDIRLLDSMEDKEIDKLIDRFNLVITEYQPQTKKILMRPSQETPLKDLDTIYEQYIVNDNVANKTHIGVKYREREGIKKRLPKHCYCKKCGLSSRIDARQDQQCDNWICSAHRIDFIDCR